MKKRKNSISGFSLVEVTFALGVVVFCLVTILGLLALGVSTTQVSTVQTSAVNILTAVASDLQATPNTVAPASKDAKKEFSPLYKIAVPQVLSNTSGPTYYYINEDGSPSTTGVTGAYYRVSVWTTGAEPSTPALPGNQETLVRVLITWPATVAYTSPQGYVETVVALGRL